MQMLIRQRAPAGSLPPLNLIGVLLTWTYGLSSHRGRGSIAGHARKQKTCEILQLFAGLTSPVGKN